MTTKEAIFLIEDHIRVHKIGKYPSIRLKNALDMALAALRVQQAPANLDRSLREGCWGCNNRDNVLSYNKFCPCCGRPLTEEAWAELERKIGGNDGTTDI